MKPFIYISILCILASSCGSKETLEKCPYSKIEWSKTSKTEEKTNGIKLVPKIKLEIEALLKKFATGKAEVELLTDFENISNQIINSSNEVDQEFANNWNSLVSDICGKWTILESDILPDSNKIEIRLDFIKKVNLFYELTFPKIEKKKIKSKDIKKDSPKEFLEIPIQLKPKHKGFKLITLNNKEAKILLNSTELNPRIKVENNSKNIQTIKIITISNDTCFLKRIFDKRHQENWPIRFIPNCHQN